MIQLLIHQILRYNTLLQNKETEIFTYVNTNFNPCQFLDNTEYYLCDNISKKSVLFSPNLNTVI